MRKITVTPRHEQGKIVVSGKASSWELVPQSNALWEEIAQVELNLTDRIWSGLLQTIFMVLWVRTSGTKEFTSSVSFPWK